MAQSSVYQPQNNRNTRNKQFEIYIDPHTNDHVLPSSRPFKTSIISATPNHKKVIHPSTVRKVGNLKPLEDKTNTIRKKNPISNHHFEKEGEGEEEEGGGGVNDSPSLKKQEKNKSLLNVNNQSPINTIKLYYRTPSTAKRAQRPPQPSLSGSDDDDDDHLGVVEDNNSPVKSSGNSVENDQFLLDFSNLDVVPEVEYGPPTAIVEEIENINYGREEEDLDQAVNFDAFFGGLHRSHNHLICSTNSIDYNEDGEEELKRVVEEDGRKENWIQEPVCLMSSYEIENELLLDSLSLPSTILENSFKRAPTNPTTTTTRQLRSMTSRSTIQSTRAPSALSIAPSRTRSRLQQIKPASSSSSSIITNHKPTSIVKPDKLSHSKYLDNFSHLVLHHQSLIDLDLAQFDSVVFAQNDPSLSDDLDQFSLDLL
ncbi:hypothetical protein MJO28_012004 [Puccinia striiformis f. sp. tritici]|uniref:Uncharacterized protein n=1 Tax=Puccinia striiformis f. sp. tritici TaxID=168172 RepID=A0ACC0DZ90_9BASI|nr:hypothetical protein MJO28_012004 [Puccinia striiformis f. sp. tritici]